jgi:hypothetical protein
VRTFRQIFPDPRHLAVLTRPGFVGAAPALASAPRLRLPQLRRPAATGSAVKVSHLPSNRQRLTAHKDAG